MPGHLTSAWTAIFRFMVTPARRLYYLKFSFVVPLQHYTQDAFLEMTMELSSIPVIPAACLVKLISYAPEQISHYRERAVKSVVLHGARSSKKHAEDECLSSNSMLLPTLYYL